MLSQAQESCFRTTEEILGSQGTGGRDVGLQGSQDPSERNGPLYMELMEPPKNPIQHKAGAFPALLYEITGNCYGLANAPRVWFNKVKTKLLGANFIQHSFDRCLFLSRQRG